MNAQADLFTMPTRQTQQRRLLDLLRSREWVSLPAILDLHIASYTRRISELREQGFVIINRKELSTEGIWHSQYSLQEEPRT